MLSHLVRLLFLATAVSIPASWSARERSAAEEIHAHQIAAHVRYLADDLLEGRAPGTRGDELAMKYIAAEYERLGLEPVGDDKTYLQHFDLVGLQSEVTAQPLFRSAAGTLALHAPEEMIVAPGQQRATARLDGAELVFVGYGITAPEQRWDDFKGVDLHNKVLVVMNNDPESDPHLFGGKTRLYYGRWDYKYAEAARHGAAGVIIIHTTPSAGYPWQVVQSSWSGTQFELPADGEPRVELRMWATEKAARQIARLGGHDLDELRRRAESRDFRPVELGVKLSVGLKTAVERTRSANVLGLLPGSDPQLKSEVLVYSAHHDHLGMRPQVKGGPVDTIYNGALDNASGVAAMLTIAEAMAKANPRPKRSVLFAAVGAEESGLLGSAYFCQHPVVPTRQLEANLNLDGINIWGRTRDVTAIGLGKSSLDTFVQTAASQQGRVVKPDQFPDRGSYYRSDQFNFARVGVPALHLDSGTDYPGHDAAWGRARIEKYEAERYHQPSDQIDSSWNLDGAVDDIRLLLVAGLRLGDTANPPRWRPNDEFEAVRKASQSAPKPPQAS